MRYVIGGGEVSSVPVDQSDTAIRRLGLSRSVVCALGHTIVADPGPAADTLPPMTKSRLDSLLAERGLFESRTRAAAAVMAGEGGGRGGGGEGGAGRRRRGARVEARADGRAGRGAERRPGGRVRLARRCEDRKCPGNVRNLGG